MSSRGKNWCRVTLNKGVERVKYTLYYLEVSCRRITADVAADIENNGPRDSHAVRAQSWPNDYVANRRFPARENSPSVGIFLLKYLPFTNSRDSGERVRRGKPVRSRIHLISD